jgi:hypothetical protein
MSAVVAGPPPMMGVGDSRILRRPRMICSKRFLPSGVFMSMNSPGRGSSSAGRPRTQRASLSKNHICVSPRVGTDRKGGGACG